MKFWIRHENRHGGPRIVNCISFSQEDAMTLAIAHNKYLHPSLDFPEFPVLDIQSVEVESDYLIYLLLQAFHVVDWRNAILDAIARQDPSFKLGEKIEVPPVERVVLT